LLAAVAGTGVSWFVLFAHALSSNRLSANMNGIFLITPLPFYKKIFK
jgi:hypothetical protein